ncbi:MAG: hypothetical protein ACRDD1_10150, partial [Planctomycetia bacterium]
MERDDFERSLRAFQRRRPFRPFQVELVNGDHFQVDHPEALVVRDGVAVFVAAGGFPTLFVPGRSSKCEDAPLRKAAANEEG